MQRLCLRCKNTRRVEQAPIKQHAQARNSKQENKELWTVLHLWFKSAWLRRVDEHTERNFIRLIKNAGNLKTECVGLETNAGMYMKKN